MCLLLLPLLLLPLLLPLLLLPLLLLLLLLLLRQPTSTTRARTGLLVELVLRCKCLTQ